MIYAKCENYLIQFILMRKLLKHVPVGRIFFSKQTLKQLDRGYIIHNKLKEKTSKEI